MLESRRDGKSKITLFKKSNRFNNYWSLSQFWPLFWYSSLEQESWLWTDSASWPRFIHVWLYLPAAEKYLRKVYAVSDLLIHSAAFLLPADLTEWRKHSSYRADPCRMLNFECFTHRSCNFWCAQEAPHLRTGFSWRAEGTFLGCVCINVPKA